MNRVLIFFMTLFLGITCASAQDIQLPEPVKTGGMPLMEALSNRQTTRDFSDKALELQDISNLLWAAYGFNREGMRTVPSANNKQEFILYVVLESGVYVYDAKENILKQKVQGDFRAKAGNQDFVAIAALNLVYVVDTDKNSAEGSAIDCGFISQNVYLYCASAGLGTVVRGWFDKDTVKEALQLSEKEVPILTQTVGHKN